MKTLKKVLIFREMEFFSPIQRKIFIFQEMETQNNFLYFLKRKLFLFFQVWKLIFQETELSYISGNNFSSSKSKMNPLLKSFLCFGKWNFLSTTLKKLLCFRKELTKPQKETKNLLQRNFLSLLTFL